jgi:addiction module RelB/DinJ family antitoxin
MKTLQVRLTDDLREEADSVLANMGLDMPTAIRLYLKKIIQTGGIPFQLGTAGVKVEPIKVDRAMQRRMDAVTSAWRKQKG